MKKQLNAQNPPAEQELQDAETHEKKHLVEKEQLVKIKHDLVSVEMLKYMAFGTLTALVDTITFALCYHFLPLKSGVLTSISQAIAWILATIFAFYTNKLFVFHSKQDSKRHFLVEIASFFGARFFTLVASILFLLLMIDLWHWNDLLAKIVSHVFVITTNYIASKVFIFKK